MPIATSLSTAVAVILPELVIVFPSPKEVMPAAPAPTPTPATVAVAVILPELLIVVPMPSE